MKISVIGTGYVGLVTGACFAEVGHEVICVDIDPDKIENLKNGKIHIYEPGLEEIVKKNIESKRLSFTTDFKTAVTSSLFVFIAVGTPQDEDGSADLKHVLDVGKQIGSIITSYKVIVVKSTVPAGTTFLVEETIKDAIDIENSGLEFDVVSNPEFLKEGDAILDFMKPDRIIIGTNNPKSSEYMKDLYAPFVKNGHPIILMDIKSSELTKYASNSMLAMRVSFMNELSILCEKIGADIESVRQGIGRDSRIGMQYLYAGLGYGGSCFPKDVKALIHILQEQDCPASILEAVEDINYKQRKYFVNKIISYFGSSFKQITIAIWGLAFKPKTDDIRESAAIEVVKTLAELEFNLQVFDPEAMINAKKILGNYHNISFCNDMYEASMNADAIVLVTEWNDFKNPKFDYLASIMKNKVIFDGRNQYNPLNMKNDGWFYFGIGRNLK